MASDRQGELGWTPPRVPAAPRLVSGVSPGSSRGKLRSEYQASGCGYGYHVLRSTGVYPGVRRGVLRRQLRVRKYYFAATLLNLLHACLVCLVRK